MKELLNSKIILILLASIITRIISVHLYGDDVVDNEWRILLENLEQNKILSVRSVDGVPVPNIFMPPLYPLLLYAVKLFFNDPVIFLNVIKIIQLVLSILSIVIFLKILSVLFEEKIVVVGTLIYALFPLNIYSVSQISSVTLQMLLINIFLYCLIFFFNKINFKHGIYFSISSALLILLRGEFFIFVLFSLFYLLIKKKKDIIKILGISFLILLVISPYLYRNYKIFGVITITKSSGYNLLKGNHPHTKVEGTGMFKKVDKVIPDVKNQIDNLKSKGPIKKHDLIMDQILLNQAIIYIKNDPIKYLNLYIKKFFSFLFIDINSTYPNYYSFLHIFPKIILSIGSLIGVFAITRFKINIPNYFSLFYIFNIGLFSLFFILARYSLFLLSIQIILSIYGFTEIKKKFINSYEKN
jgi:hypothetical protein